MCLSCYRRITDKMSKEIHKNDSYVYLSVQWARVGVCVWKLWLYFTQNIHYLCASGHGNGERTHKSTQNNTQTILFPLVHLFLFFFFVYYFADMHYYKEKLFVYPHHYFSAKKCYHYFYEMSRKLSQEIIYFILSSKKTTTKMTV